MNNWESRSPHVGESLIRVEFYLWNPEQNSRNPQPPLHENDWNPGHWNSESTVWNPGSKTVLDFLTWGDPYLKKKYKIRLILLVIN